MRRPSDWPGDATEGCHHGLRRLSPGSSPSDRTIYVAGRWSSSVVAKLSTEQLVGVDACLLEPAAEASDRQQRKSELAIKS